MPISALVFASGAPSCISKNANRPRLADVDDVFSFAAVVVGREQSLTAVFVSVGDAHIEHRRVAQNGLAGVDAVDDLIF